MLGRTCESNLPSPNVRIIVAQKVTFPSFGTICQLGGLWDMVETFLHHHTVSQDSFQENGPCSIMARPAQLHTRIAALPAQLYQERNGNRSKIQWLQGQNMVRKRRETFIFRVLICVSQGRGSKLLLWEMQDQRALGPPRPSYVLEINLHEAPKVPPWEHLSVATRLTLPLQTVSWFFFFGGAKHSCGIPLSYGFLKTLSFAFLVIPPFSISLGSIMCVF